MTTRTEKALKQLSQASTNLQVSAGIDNGHRGPETIADTKWMIGKVVGKLGLFLDDRHAGGRSRAGIASDLRKLADKIERSGWYAGLGGVDDGGY